MARIQHVNEHIDFVFQMCFLKAKIYVIKDDSDYLFDS